MLGLFDSYDPPNRSFTAHFAKPYVEKRQVKIIYPAPAPDLLDRMAAALSVVPLDKLADLHARLDAYERVLTIDDILALRKKVWLTLDAAAQERRRAQ